MVDSILLWCYKAIYIQYFPVDKRVLYAAINNGI